MKTMILTTLLAAAVAQRVAPPNTVITSPHEFMPDNMKACSRLIDCNQWGDSAATCNVATGRCECTQDAANTYRLVTHSQTVTAGASQQTNTYYNCIARTELWDTTKLRQVQTIVSMTFSEATCSEVSRYNASFENEVRKHFYTVSSAINKVNEIAHGCGLEGMNIAISLNLTVRDLYNPQLLWSYPSILRNQVNNHAILGPALGRATRNERIYTVGSALEQCPQRLGYSLQAYISHRECMAITCVGGYTFIDGKCLPTIVFVDQDDDVAEWKIGAIAGGAGLFLIILIIIIVCCCFKKQDTSDDNDSSSSSSSSDSFKEPTKEVIEEPTKPEEPASEVVVEDPVDKKLPTRRSGKGSGYQSTFAY